MNQLSWLLYVGNVAGNAGPAFIMLGLAFFAVSAILFIVYQCHLNDIISALRYDMTGEKAKQAVKKNRVTPFQGFLVTLSITFLLLAVACPSQDTVYAIAASQVGGQVVTSPLAVKTEQALESWLDKQIAANTPAPTSATPSK
jgi:hypothetical protein